MLPSKVFFYCLKETGNLTPSVCLNVTCIVEDSVTLQNNPSQTSTFTTTEMGKTFISLNRHRQFYYSWVTLMSRLRYVARTKQTLCDTVRVCIPWYNLRSFPCQSLPCSSLFHVSCPFLCPCPSFSSTSSTHTRHMSAPSSNSQCRGQQQPMMALKNHMNTHTHTHR